jgi:hypothetical protein
LLRTVEQGGVKRATQRVGGDVVAVSSTRGGRGIQGVEDPLHLGPDAPMVGATATRSEWPGGAGEVKQMLAFGVVERQRVGEPLQHELGHAAEVAALQSLVVLDADTGQRGDLFATQARHAPGAVARQSGLLRGDPCPARGEELGDVVARVHAVQRRPVLTRLGCPVSTPVTRPPTFSPIVLD